MKTSRSTFAPSLSISSKKRKESVPVARHFERV
jgi:hypothetical protein